MPGDGRPVTAGNVRTGSACLSQHLFVVSVATTVVVEGSRVMGQMLLVRLLAICSEELVGRGGW